MKKLIVSFSFCLFLNACGHIESEWTCKAQNGGTCLSMEENDYNYVKNKNKDEQEKLNKKIEKINLEKQKNIKDVDSFNTLRSKEELGRVVFVPYVDKAKNRHEISTVYYVKYQSDWSE
jgi:hypothetical protein